MSDARFLTLLAVIILAGAFAAPHEETSIAALVVSICLFAAAIAFAWNAAR